MSAVIFQRIRYDDWNDIAAVGMVDPFIGVGEDECARGLETKLSTISLEW